MSWSWSGQHRDPEMREPGTPHRRWERGQTLAIVAIMLVALIAMLALVVDLGVAYGQRRAMQNAADAGALAGARALALAVPPGQEQDEAAVAAAHAAISKYTGINGADSYEAVVASPYVTVTTHKRTSTFFARVIGIPHTDVAALAAAKFVPGRPPGFLPITLHESMWAVSDTYQIWASDSDPLNPPETYVPTAYRGWLNLDGGPVPSSPDELRCWVCPGTCTPTMATAPGVNGGLWVNGDPGIRASVLQAVEDCTIGMLLPIPIFDVACNKGEPCWEHLGSGSENYNIIGFAMFTITGVEETSNPKYVEGKFASGPVVLSDVLGDETLKDLGPRTVKLVR